MPHFKVNVSMELQAVNKEEARAKANYELDKQAYAFDVNSVSETGPAPVDEYVDENYEANQYLKG